MKDLWAPADASSPEKNIQLFKTRFLIIIL